MSGILFSITEDQIIIRTARGVYKQCHVARRGKNIYAKAGGGFVMLYANGTTSHPDLRWEELEGAARYVPGPLGRLVAPEPQAVPA